MTTIIVCVLKVGGGEFWARHLERLYRMRDWHASSAPFICLTDEELVCPSIGRRLAHGWRGWWSKIEAYQLPGPCLYLDLDVTVMGDIAPLLEATARHDLVVMRDPQHKINTSVVGWRGDVSSLYREFARAPKAHMSTYSDRARWGDQAFVRDHWRGEFSYWDEVCPGLVRDWKIELRKGVPMGDARVCVSHGLPRPWETGGLDEWLAKKGVAA